MCCVHADRHKTAHVHGPLANLQTDPILLPFHSFINVREDHRGNDKKKKTSGNVYILFINGVFLHGKLSSLHLFDPQSLS